MSGYFNQTNTALQRGIASYSRYLDKKAEREYRQERDAVADHKWSLSHDINLQQNERAEESHSASMAEHNWRKEDRGDKKAHRGLLSEAVLAQGNSREFDGFETIGGEVNASGFTTARGTGAENPNGRATGMVVRPVGQDPESGEELVTLGVSRRGEDGSESIGLVTADGSDDGEPVVLTRSEMEAAKKHVGGVMDMAHQAGYSEEDAAAIGWSSINDDGTAASEEELAERVAGLGKGVAAGGAQAKKDFVEGGVPAVVMSGLRPLKNAWDSIPDGLKPAGFRDTAAYLASGVAGGAGMLVGGEKKRAAWEAGTSAAVSGRQPEAPKAENGRKLVGQGGSPNAHNIKTLSDLTKLSDHYKANPDARTAAIRKEVKPKDFRSFLDAQAEQRSGKTRVERAKLASKAVLVGGDEQQWMNYVESGNMWLTKEDLQYHEQRLAATYRSHQPKGAKPKTSGEIWKESQSEFSDVAKRAVGSVVSDSDMAAQIVKKAEISYTRHAASTGNYVNPNDPNSISTMQEAVLSFTRKQMSGDFGEIHLGPEIASKTNGIDSSAYSKEEVLQAVELHANNLHKVSSMKFEDGPSKGDNYNGDLVGAVAIEMGAMYRAAGGRGYNTPAELREIERLVKSAKSNDELRDTVRALKAKRTDMFGEEPPAQRPPAQRPPAQRPPAPTVSSPGSVSPEENAQIDAAIQAGNAVTAVDGGTVDTSRASPELRAQVERAIEAGVSAEDIVNLGKGYLRIIS